MNWKHYLVDSTGSSWGNRNDLDTESSVFTSFDNHISFSWVDLITKKKQEETGLEEIYNTSSLRAWNYHPTLHFINGWPCHIFLNTMITYSFFLSRPFVTPIYQSTGSFKISWSVRVYQTIFHRHVSYELKIHVTFIIPELTFSFDVWNQFVLNQKRLPISTQFMHVNTLIKTFQLVNKDLFFS